jgi:hypothetical protein
MSNAEPREIDMKGAFSLVVGVAIGLFAAHQIAKTPRGKQFFDDVDGKAKEFGDAIVDGYRQRESELKRVISDADDVITDLTARIKHQTSE